jgi:hypothetical protein
VTNLSRLKLAIQLRIRAVLAGRGIAMKTRMVIALLAAASFTGESSAADWPVTALPQPYRPGPLLPVEWTGLYFGTTPAMARPKDRQLQFSRAHWRAAQQPHWDLARRSLVVRSCSAQAVHAAGLLEVKWVLTGSPGCSSSALRLMPSGQDSRTPPLLSALLPVPPPKP